MDWLRGSKVLIGVALVALTGMFVAACGGSDDDSTETSNGLTKAELLLPFNESISFYPLIVARDQGFLEDEGVEVESVVADSGASVVQQLTAGNVDYGVTNAENILIGASRGAPLRAVEELNSGVFTIAAPATSDVKSPADLDGASIGLTDATGGEVPLVNAVLEEEGLTANEDVQTPVVGPGGPAVYTAFQNGTIDAYAGADNDLAGVVAEGMELQSILDDKYGDLPTNYLVATQDTLDDESKREIAIKIGRAWNKGVQFTIDNPEQAMKITCDAVPEECQNPGAAQAYFDSAMRTYAPPETGPMGQPDMDGLNTLLETIVADDLAGDVNLEETFPETYIDELQPE